MYKEIDELIEVICQSQIFINYTQSHKQLDNPEIMNLLSRHQMLQDDYLRMKRYQNYVSNDQLKAELKAVKYELSENPIVNDYYQSYHSLNDLLENITEIAFAGISDEISFDTWVL